MTAIRSWDTTAPYHTTYQYMDSGNNRYGLVKKIQNGTAAIQYTYDANGNITSITEGVKTNNYYYDKRNQLIRVDDQVQGKTFAYGYDLGGNMTRIREYAYTTASTLPDTPVKTITGTYDSAWKDKLLTWNGVTMTYDAVGNMTKKGSTTFTWTKGRKLSGATIPKSDGTTTEASYVYDHTGTRIRKTVDGTVTNFRMAGDLLTSQQKGTQVTYFAYDSAGTLIAMAAANQWYFYVRNAQNDIIGLIDAAGNLVVEYKYDAWGRILSTTGSKASDIGKRNPFRYRGYYYDEETGMYYLKSRYYDPELKRFICADTMLSSSINGANVFSYCENNPVNRYDPMGYNGLANFWNLFKNALWESRGSFAVAGGITQLDSPAIGIADIVGFASATVTIAVCLGTAITNTVYNQDVKSKEREEIVSTYKPPKHQAYFTNDPLDFRPLGLTRKIRVPIGEGKNGGIIKWDLPGINISIFEWNEDYQYSAHYHVMMPRDKNRHINGMHYKPGMAVPEPWNTLYFGG